MVTFGSYNFNQKSSRIVVQGETKSEVERRVREHKVRGFKALMEVKEEIDFEGRTYYVCVMDNPKLREQKKNPSQ